MDESISRFDAQGSRRRQFAVHAPLSQFGRAFGQSLSSRHCTQRPLLSSQSGVVGLPAQSAALTHCTHALFGEHSGVAVPAQSALARHCTQLEVVVLQRGAEAPHSAFVLQPVRQKNPSGSQIGAEAPQSEFARHATHSSLPRLQRGFDAPQSALFVHSTQLFESGSHTAVAPRPTQSTAVVQPMH